MLHEEKKRNQPSSLETINAGVGAAKEYDNYDWQSPTSKLTFDAMHQIEQLQKKTKRLVGAIEFQPEQQKWKEATLHTVQEGKAIAYVHLKLIRFADREEEKAAIDFKGETEVPLNNSRKQDRNCKGDCQYGKEFK